jgi:ActR/RegA family two-component response regulator
MKSLLLLDDDDVLRESLKNNLTKFFDSIYEAADIQQALEKIKSYTINFYLLDLNLPDGNGLQLIPTILEHNKNSHIIVSRGYSKRF